MLDTGTDLVNAFYEVVDDFPVDLGNAFRSAGISAITSFLTAELAESLGVNSDSFGGALFSYAAGQGINSVLDAVLSNVLGGATDVLANFGGSLFNIAGGLGAFVGTYLAKDVVGVENIGGAIGQSLGGAIGGTLLAIGSVQTAIATSLGLSALFQGASVVLSFILPGVGAFLGAILGTLIGNLLGGGSDAGFGDFHAELGVGGTKFVNGYGAGEDADFVRPTTTARDTALTIINSFIAATGGKVVSDSTLTLQFYARGDSDGDRWSWARVTETSPDGSPDDTYFAQLDTRVMAKLVQWAVIQGLKRLEIGGGEGRWRRSSRAGHNLPQETPAAFAEAVLAAA